MGENISKIFYKEVSEKKRVGRGVYNRASRRGYVGSVKTTVDFLSRKEKREYMRGSEIKVSNIYDDLSNIPTLTEIKEMEFDRVKQILTYIKSKHSCTKVAKQWNLSSTSSVYSIYYKYGVVEKKQRDYISPKKKREKNSKIKNEIKEVVQENIPIVVDSEELLILREKYNSLLSEHNKLKEELSSQQSVGFSISFKGTYEKEFVENKITNILLTMDDNTKYALSFELVELEK